jgi:DDE family transposase
VLTALEDLLQDATAGDPISGLKWSRKTLEKLSSQLRTEGVIIGRSTIARLLRERDYSLKSNRKSIASTHDPDRDRQFRYIEKQRRAFEKAGNPVISVDTKKKELIGRFKNPGRTWRQSALEVNDHDFPSQAEGKAIPYGIYDLRRNSGYVLVGISHETPEFAIAAIRRWWLVCGQRSYAGTERLLIQADCGGANSNRSWRWKNALQRLADEFQLTITVTHFPPSASKWNPIEHRMFSLISANWAGEPLLSYETVVKFIRTTRSKSGFECQARLDRTIYPTKVKLSPAQRDQIDCRPHRLYPHWNYTIRPHPRPRK